MSKALEEKASEFLQQIQLMRATETELRKQLESYGSKFGEFQEALTKSNQARWWWGGSMRVVQIIMRWG
jgi:hypothetical protein